MKEDALTKCPKCKKKKLERLLGTGAGLLFKGSGFYITDYGKDGKGPRKESASSSSSSTESSSASKDAPAESKASAPAEKAEKPRKSAAKKAKE